VTLITNVPRSEGADARGELFASSPPGEFNRVQTCSISNSRCISRRRRSASPGDVIGITDQSAPTEENILVALEPMI